MKMRLKSMLKLLLDLRTLPSRKKNNKELKKKPRSEWKKKPNQSQDKEVLPSTRVPSLTMEELQSDQEDQEDLEALVLEPQEAAPRVDLQRRSSERESSK